MGRWISILTLWSNWLLFTKPCTDDRTKCQTVVDKLVPFVKVKGTVAQRKRALRVLLPESPIFGYLEGRIPHPSHTLEKLIHLVEGEEKEKINKEIAKRRSRLGAVLAQVTLDVKREVYSDSPLEELYQELINWSDDEEVRRVTDSKLLQHCYEKLLAFPEEKKTALRSRVWKLAEGLVILKYPYELAWYIMIEWKDCENIGATLSNIFSPRSVLAFRIVGEYAAMLEEYKTVVGVTRRGLKSMAVDYHYTGLVLQKNSDAMKVILARALIHYESPKHHDEAKDLFEDVLQRNSKYGSALVGLGLILEEQHNYDDAADFLTQALALDPNDLKIMSEEAWCDVLRGNFSEGLTKLKECLSRITGLDARSRDFKAQVLWRIGQALWDSNEGRADRGGPYNYFRSAIESNQNFAPAYTSLGIYYQDMEENSDRADKCFQKAFEISAGELEAAERLARSFAESRDWELVEIVARRAAEADKKRSVPGKGVSWPQSAIGVVELNAQNFTLATLAFQNALRTSPDDFHSLIGLGEAQASAGRYITALKAFLKAEALDPLNWFAKYMLANVRRDIGEYEEASIGYRAVLQWRPQEFGVLVALSETQLASAWHYIETGFFGRAADSAVESLEVAQKIVIERPDSFNLWKTVGDCCLVFTWIQSLVNRLPRDLVVKLLKTDIELSEFDILSEVDGVGSSALSDAEVDGLTLCLDMAILAYKRAIYASAEDRHAHAVAWFNLGCAEYRSYLILPDRPMRHRMAAIRCFKRTIKLEPGNHEFWNALGVATGELNPKVAQHALVRALHINEKNSRVWVNLATLYLLQNDIQLANEAFSRAQSADPEYALAWVGQGIIAAMTGNEADAQDLFEHAFEIADNSSSFVKRQFSTATFDKVVQLQHESGLVSLVGPVFALQKLREQESDEPVALRLAALFGERIKDFVSASEKLGVVCEKVEQKYENIELEEDLICYAQAKADLARVKLGQKDYEAAIENATLALDLSGEITRLEECRLSAHLTAGLGYYYSGDMNESLDMFKAALNESSENPDVVCLLSQVLWAKGGNEEWDVAREQLFTCIEQNPDHLQSIMLLGAIGILDHNEDILEAVIDDLQAVRGREGLNKTSKQKVDNLLTKMAQLQERDDAITVATKSIFIQPSLSSAWNNLAKLSGGNDHVTEMALRVAQESKVLDAEELSFAYAQQGIMSCNQRAILIAPWKAEGWVSLAEDVQAAV
ncbi:protein prenylyltransferase [Choiromyces venosus 120613-1]|uniref:Protein prenylyltransferase n=1 Tax=Choiromyces venosus 120613-1 TaxID=1336337 RepID=A0A3N4J5R9_9PEZI|nr:protein prenylyltransferase [Choiromyces venosus 120613-1]